MLVVVRDAAASTQRRSSPALREGQRGASQRENQCDRGCTSARRIAVRDLDDHTHETAASEYHPRIVAIASHPTPRGVSSPQERA